MTLATEHHETLHASVSHRLPSQPSAAWAFYEAFVRFGAVELIAGGTCVESLVDQWLPPLS